MNNKAFRSAKEKLSYDKTLVGIYMKLLKKNHFVFFGLPFMLSIVAGSIYLQKFTSVKWEQYDQKYQEYTEREALSLLKNRREFSPKEDFYRLQGFLKDHVDEISDDYEMVRVDRAKEDEPVWWRTSS